MTNKEILKKAVEKAIEGKWLEIKELKKAYFTEDEDNFQIHYIAHYGEYTFENFNPYKLIFSHDFAKAFWGDEEGENEIDFIHVKPKGDSSFTSKMLNQDFLKHFSEEKLKLLLDKKSHKFGEHTYLGAITYYKHKEGWQYHLQQMVLEKEPLKYIERFL